MGGAICTKFLIIRSYICRVYVKKMLKICTKFLMIRSYICRVYVKKMLKICTKFLIIRSYICRVYVKKMLKYVPIIGWAWGFSDVAFLERNWEKVNILIYEVLAGVPSVAQGSHNYSRRFPALGPKLRFYLFLSLKVDPL